MKLARAIDRLAELREDMRELSSKANACRAKILAAGGGESQKWVALVSEISGYTAQYRASRRVILRKKL